MGKVCQSAFISGEMTNAMQYLYQNIKMGILVTALVMDSFRQEVVSIDIGGFKRRKYGLFKLFIDSALMVDPS